MDNVLAMNPEGVFSKWTQLGSPCNVSVLPCLGNPWQGGRNSPRNGGNKTLETLELWDAFQGQWQVWTGPGLNLQDKPCVLKLAEPELLGYPSLWNPEDCE